MRQKLGCIICGQSYFYNDLKNEASRIFYCSKCDKNSQDDLRAFNNLSGLKVYLAGNIEFTSGAISWREKMANSLKELRVKVLDPTKPCLIDQTKEDDENKKKLVNWRQKGEVKKVQEFMKGVVRRDLRLVDVSDFVIFRLEPTKPTFGTIHELVVALQQRKPCLILVPDKKKLPLWLFGIIDFDLVFEKEKDLLDYLRRIHYGYKEVDTKYWRFLLPELR